MVSYVDAPEWIQNKYAEFEKSGVPEVIVLVAVDPKQHPTAVRFSEDFDKAADYAVQMAKKGFSVLMAAPAKEGFAAWEVRRAGTFHEIGSSVRIAMEEDYRRAISEFKERAEYLETEDRLYEIMDKAGIKYKKEVLERLIREGLISFDPKRKDEQYIMNLIYDAKIISSNGKPVPPREYPAEQEIEADYQKAVDYFKAHVGYTETEERLMRFMSDARVKHKKEVLNRLIREGKVIYEPDVKTDYKYTLKFIASTEPQANLKNRR